MKFKKAACLLGLAAFLSGAASAQPADAPLSPSTTIVFKRNPGFAGRDCESVISINGVPRAKVKMNEVLQALVPPGKHRVLARASTGACSNFAAAYDVVTAGGVLTISVERE